MFHTIPFRIFRLKHSVVGVPEWTLVYTDHGQNIWGPNNGRLRSTADEISRILKNRPLPSWKKETNGDSKCLVAKKTIEISDRFWEWGTVAMKPQAWCFILELNSIHLIHLWEKTWQNNFEPLNIPGFPPPATSLLRPPHRRPRPQNPGISQQTDDGENPAVAVAKPTESG